MKKLKPILLLITILLYIQAFSQELYSSAGDYYENSGILLSFSIGEPAIETYQSSNIILTQGFNQTGLSVTGIENINKKAEEIFLYPNPVSAQLFVQINTENQNYQYNIRTINGNLIKKGNASGNKFEVAFSGLNEAVYILEILNNNILVKSCRIIKQ